VGRCGKCGQILGSHEVHPAEACMRQQDINRRNLGHSCAYCGAAGYHKDGCPEGYWEERPTARWATPRYA